MPNLKDLISQDIGTLFFNFDEFAETVKIDGVPQQVVIDDDRLSKRAAAEYEGFATGMILYFIPVEAFSEKPKVGNAQNFNGSLMWVDDVKQNAGVYEVILTQNRGG